jgi:hypothetical protein
MKKSEFGFYCVAKNQKEKPFEYHEASFFVGKEQKHCRSASRRKKLSFLKNEGESRKWHNWRAGFVFSVEREKML